MAEKYYSISPYAYVNNNPMKFVDPTGMFFDGYTVDQQGYIQRINDEGGNQYDVLYNKSLYTEQSRKDYDQTGDKKGIQVSKGIIQSERSAKFTETNQEGHSTNNIIRNHQYQVETDQEAQNIMNFMDKNTDVEWGNTHVVNSNGDEANFLMTSHQRTTIKGATYRMSQYRRDGYNVIRADHTHPDNHEPSKGDISVRDNIYLNSPKANFRILYKGKYYNY